MRLALLGGSYTARSIIANAQRCVNLYQEHNQPDAPVPITTYPTPGLDLLVPGPIKAPVRCTFRTSNGDLYVAIGTNVYYVDPNFALTLLGTIDSGTNQVSMQDNGLALIIVDGTANGYAVDLTTRAFAPINDENFYGADKVDYLDTFFVLNRPGTNQFYISLSNASYIMLTGGTGAIVTGSILAPGTAYTAGTHTNVALTGGAGTGAKATIVVASGGITTVTITATGMNYLVDDVLSAAAADIGGTGTGFQYSVDSIAGAFDPLDIAAKTAYPDKLSSLIVMFRNIWLVGQLTSEIWYNSGRADFTFEQQPGTFVEHGCVAKYSLAAQDLFTYWLSQDKQGQLLVLQGNSYMAKRISTHAIENEFLAYPTVSDAIGFTYQQEGHVFYFLVFPSADKTWVYDVSTELWHERAWIDNQGNFHRHRANCGTFAYGKNVVGDWENGNLYAFNLNTHTDVGQPISRIRSFPHLIMEDDRVTYQSFSADMEVGEYTGDGDVTVSLRWSDNRGKTYGNRIEQSLGSKGQYLTNAQFNRLGMARDRVFELSWSGNVKTSLNGAFIQYQPASS